MKVIYYRIFLLWVLTLLTANAYAGLQPLRLTCERKVNPLGIEALQPRFGWWIDATKPGTVQGAYQIKVIQASGKSFDANAASIWDSKKVHSGNNSAVLYEGPQLSSAHKYYWRIRVWDQFGNVSKWSDVAEFTMGLLSDTDWGKARWIGFDSLPDSLRLIPGAHGHGNSLADKVQKRAVNPYFRKPFVVNKKISQATVFVSGLGHYELYLNGKKVGKDFLSPGWTNYEKNCQYNTYDVSEALTNGENVLGCLVGTGFFYINKERYRKYVGAYGYPMVRLVLRLRYTDGSENEIVTDGSWKTAESAISYSSIYGGEDYDARLEQPGWNTPGFDDARWKQVVLATGPAGKMSAQIEHPVRIMDTISVKNITPIGTGSYIYDFGQNASGIIELKVQGKAGDTVRIIPSEMLDDGGLITQRSSGGPYYFEYVLKGGDVEEWAPKFTYYGFRYARVEGGFPGNVYHGKGVKIISVRMLHTRNSAPSTGSFECSNPLFNKIHDLIDWALKSNIASVSTDCPHREKMGWLEQAHLMGESLKYRYDISNFYRKIVNDITEAQLPNGMVPSIAPEYVHFDGPFRDDPGYGSAAVVLPWYLYKWYGDTQILSQSYQMMARYVDYLTGKSDSYIVSHGLGDWLDLGEKEPGISQLTPISLTATAFYYQDVVLLSKTAGVLNLKDDEKKYSILAGKIKAAFNKKFYDPATNVYGSGSQTSYTMPLFLDLLENEGDKKKVLKNLIDSIIVHQKKITAGDIGHRFLVKTLQQTGNSNLLFEMNNRSDIPGYGYQIKHGATALAEHWSGPTVTWLSQNHMIFGHLMEWLYGGLGGIRQGDGDAGFKQIVIDPQIAGDITWAKASYESVNGIIKSEWERSGRVFKLRVVIPVNASADVVLPVSNTQNVTIDGNPFGKFKGARDTRYENSKLVFSLPAGTYQITCNDTSF